MTTRLDVLVIGSDPGEGVARRLGDAGDRVHRCQGDHGTGTPCRGVIDVDDCPLERGADVAVVAPDGARDDPLLGQAVSCAIRAGVPVVETGRSPALAAYEPWLAGRYDGDGEVAEAVAAAARRGFATMERAILAMTGPLLDDLGIPRGEVGCTIDRHGTRLHVRIGLPVRVDEAARQAVAVRALAGLRDLRRRHESVNVDVHGPRDAAPAG